PAACWVARRSLRCAVRVRQSPDAVLGPRPDTATYILRLEPPGYGSPRPSVRWCMGSSWAWSHPPSRGDTTLTRPVKLRRCNYDGDHLGTVGSMIWVNTST